MSRASWKGTLVVLSAPSGAGKTSLCRAAVERLPFLKHSVSYTTRSPRRGEKNGRDYSFVDKESFEGMIRDGEFVEWARVHGHLYGTAKRVLREILDQGSDVILDIDAQGARTLMSLTDFPAVFIFVVTPTFKELEKRLRRRGSDSEEEIWKRLTRAREEIAQYQRYDYLLVNDEFDRAVEDLVSVVRAERCAVRHVDHQWLKREFLGG